MIYEIRETKLAAHLFDGWQETMIWSCIQGVMGKIYTACPGEPISAAARLGDFYFLAGEPDEALVMCEKGRQDFMIMVPQHPGWEGMIERCLGAKARRVTRYAMKKESDVFDREKLQMLVDGLPDGYVLKRMDEPLFWQCREIEWCRDFVSQYKDYAHYETYGLGVIMLKDGEPVSGASSYSGYVGGIEIEIDTREDYRRKGLATVCGAGLILECIKRGLYPSWDAQNRWSVALAEKLGYHFDHEYAAYEIFK